MLAFLVNLFNVNVVGDGCPVRQSFVTNLSAEEMKPTEMQEDMALKIPVSATLQLSSGDRFQKVNTQSLKDHCTTHFRI